MSRSLALLLALAALAPSLAFAGPWPRGKGNTFLAFSVQTEGVDEKGRPQMFYSAYGEYGLTPRLTLGLDLGRDDDGLSKAFGFLRLPLLDDRHDWKLAGEIGLGQEGGRSALRPGLSLGRAFKLRERYGWTSLDTRAVTFQGGDTLWEAELTVGLNTHERFKTILQLQGGLPDEGRDYLRLVPTAVWQFRPGRHVELGATTGLDGHTDDGLKLGLWLEF